MEKKSKVAFCNKCKGLIKACHVDYLSKATEKEFTELLNEGFSVKLEAIKQTQKRTMVTYSSHKNGKCN